MSELGTKELLEASGTTIRMVDYWASNGVITALPGPTGSGHRRKWDAKNVAYCTTLRQLQEGLSFGYTQGVLTTDIMELIVTYYDLGYLDLGHGASLSWVPMDYD